MEVLKLELLGGMRISQGGRLLAAELSKKAQALLCYLAVTNRPHTREALAGLLWSDFPEHRARANLRDALSDLHRTIPHYLVIEQNRVAFIDDPMQVWIDSAVLQNNFEQTQQALRKRPSPAMLPVDLVAQLEAGIDLYQGEFLAEFYVRRAAVFEEWLSGQRERLRQVAAEVLRILAAYHTSSGGYTDGLRCARRLLALDPWREEGHRLLMRLLALSGQQSVALKQYEICRQVLGDELGLEPAAETAALYEAIRTGEVEPDRLDTRGYELVALIGQGETSAVYRAYQPTVRREVAIKIILPEFVSDPTFFERFELVAQTVAQLEFPWIVPVYDYWQETDAAYLIMRLLRGGNLENRLAEPWPLEKAVRLVEQVASALATAHEAGVVHGNLRPTNILLDDEGNAYVSDFGTISDEFARQINHLPRYLSPEQQRGEPATAGSDIYALGLIVGEMLAGGAAKGRTEERPYRRSNGREKILAKLAHALSVLGNDRAANVEMVIRRATALQADGRFDTVLDFSSALHRAMERRLYETQPVSAGQRQRYGTQLPPDETPFIGRKKELAMLNKLIDDPLTRLINITGPGGIGKTRLALTAAREQNAHFPHGVFLVPLLSVEASDQVAGAITAALELPIKEERSLQQQLLDYLQDKHLLLVLDNFEHLIASKGLLAQMVSQAPRVSILVTSREVLHLHEEQLFPLAGLTLPAAELVEDVFEADASQLFINSARRLQPDFSLYKTDVDALKRICQLVEGMPLAIELAAGWANTIGLPQIVAELRRSFDFLQDRNGGMADRHASIEAVFAASWQQLGQQDRLVFKKLSVFRGGFSLEAARQISGISFGSLSHLVSKSLLQFDRGSDRYQMHELLRQFAVLKLAEDKDEEAAVLGNHATYYCQLLGEKVSELKSRRQDIALGEILADQGNIRKAWKTAAEIGLIDLIDQAVDSLYLYCRYRFVPDEFVNACQIVVDQLQKLVERKSLSAQTRRTLAKIRAMQATPYMHATLGSDYLATMESLQALRQSRETFQELALAGEDVRREQAFVLLRLGALQLNIELDQCTPLLEESLALYQQLNDRWGQSEALLTLSSARLRLAGYLAAKPLWEECLAIKREEGDRRGLADSLAVLGIRAASHNRTADALQYARECYDTYVQISDRASQAEAHWNLGVLMTWAGQYAQAKESLTKAEALYGELGLKPPALILGNALAMLGEYEAVVAYVDRYMTAVGVTDKKPNEARAYNWLFYAAMAREDYAEARRLSQKSIAAYEACGLRAYAGIGYCFLGVVSLKLADGAPAWGYLEQGLRILQDRNQLGPLGIWLCAPMTAVLLADAGLLEEAIAAYTFANHHPMIANSVWFSEVMGDVLRKVEADLSPMQVARAHKQGRDAEPWQMGADFLTMVSAIKGQRTT